MSYDALLFVSFGGPEGPDEVMPFLENVVRGRPVPRERLEEVAEHYVHFDGKSPINDQCRALIKALGPELTRRDIALPIYWGNRNWHPMLKDTVAEMKKDGVKRALAYVTSAYGSFSGCRQYLNHLATACEEVGEGAPVIDKIRLFYDHPLFIEALASRLSDVLPDPGSASSRVVFTAHSIPQAMARGCAYEEQLKQTCAWVASMLAIENWDLVYQSRSGPPQVPWLEPDIGDHIDRLADEGMKRVVLSPIGFLSDHMEVVWDLDHEARDRAEARGLSLTRAQTVGSHPRFVEMIGELVQERMSEGVPRRSMGRGPSPDVCAPDCCAYVSRGRP